MRACATVLAVAPMPTLASGYHHSWRVVRSSLTCALRWSYTEKDTARYGTTVAPDSSAPLYSPAWIAGS